MEADYDDFKIIPKYRNALPRSTYDELRALDQKLIQRGQQKPIDVRRDMGILDGYTRHDLLGQRGKKIKYTFMDFPDEQAEFEYVVETNVMRRQLNVFQRVEAMHQFFLDETLARRESMHTSKYDILQAIKDGKSTTLEIKSVTKYSLGSVKRMVTELKSIYCITSNVYKPYKGQGGSKFLMYKIMPKGEEMLSKHVPRQVGTVANMMGKIIGAGTSTVSFATVIIDKGSEDVKQQLRDGKISIRGAHETLIGKKSKVGESKGVVWGKFARIKCSHCGHVGGKGDYIKI